MNKSIYNYEALINYKQDNDENKSENKYLEYL